MYRQFNFPDLILGSRSLRTPYVKGLKTKTGIHWGQRKLLMSEIEFLTYYWGKEEVPNPLVVYAGAAPADHTDLLSAMFPDVTFHLYDPAPFSIQESEKIKLFNEYFTDEVATKYAGRNDVFFISDIRTSDFQARHREANEQMKQLQEKGELKKEIVEEKYSEADQQTEADVARDMEWQARWVMIIDPVHAFLKFRLPYCNGVDIPTEYLKGIVYLQPWAPHKSSETRLKPVRGPSGKYEMATWSALEYEEWCFHHNINVRVDDLYKNVFTGSERPLDGDELLNDYDSTAEAFLLQKYFEKIGVTQNVPEKCVQLSRLITQHLNKHRRPLTLAKLRKENERAKDPFIAKLRPFEKLVQEQQQSPKPLSPVVPQQVVLTPAVPSPKKEPVPLQPLKLTVAIPKLKARK